MHLCIQTQILGARSTCPLATTLFLRRRILALVAVAAAPAAAGMQHSRQEPLSPCVQSVYNSSPGHGSLPASALITSGVDSLGTSTDPAMRASAMATAEVHAMRGQQAALEHALDALVDARPPGIFLGRFVLVRERAHGSQVLVQFCHDAGSGQDRYAIKVRPALSSSRA